MTPQGEKCERCGGSGHFAVQVSMSRAIGLCPACNGTGRKPNPQGVGRGQRQDSLTDQLRDLGSMAVQQGMYDAADWINRQLVAPAPSEQGEPVAQALDHAEELEAIASRASYGHPRTPEEYEQLTDDALRMSHDLLAARASPAEQGEVERLRRERDEARADAVEAGWVDQEQLAREKDAASDRAEAAEFEVERLRKDVAGLEMLWEAEGAEWGDRLAEARSELNRALSPPDSECENDG